MLRLRSTRTYLVVSFVVIMLFSGYVLFHRLGTEPFQDYDEATYAEVTHESLVRGNPTDLTFLHQPYFRKPPLLFWLTTTSAQIFEDVEFAVRFPSALAGFLTILLVMGICYEVGVRKRIVLFSGAVLATTATWMEFARDVRFDTLVGLCSAAALYAAVRATRDARWYVMVGIALALAVLSKNVMAAFGGVAVLSYVLLRLGGKGALALLKEKYLWLGVGAFFFIALPWHLYMTGVYGGAFWNSYLGSEVITRASTNLFPGGGNPTNAQYLGYVANFAAPWIQIFILSLIASPFIWKRMSVEVRSIFGASVLTVLAVLVVMFTAQTKAFGYLIPMYPFMAIAVALAVGEVMQATHRNLYLRKGLTSAFVMLVIFAGLTTWYNALHLNPYYGSELGMAEEEHAIAEIIKESPESTVYTYGYNQLGTILYYSRIPDRSDPYIHVWSASSTPSATTLILATTTLTSLQEAFPNTTLTEVYSGTFVSLFTAAD